MSYGNQDAASYQGADRADRRAASHAVSHLRCAGDRGQCVSDEPGLCVGAGISQLLPGQGAAQPAHRQAVGRRGVRRRLLVAARARAGRTRKARGRADYVQLERHAVTVVAGTNLEAEEVPSMHRGVAATDALDVGTSFIADPPDTVRQGVFVPERDTRIASETVQRTDQTLAGSTGCLHLVYREFQWCRTCVLRRHSSWVGGATKGWRRDWRRSRTATNRAGNAPRDHRGHDAHDRSLEDSFPAWDQSRHGKANGHGRG